MSNQRKPSIVFVHGIWADGSSFSKLIPSFQADGHEVIAARFALTCSLRTSPRLKAHCAASAAGRSSSNNVWVHTYHSCRN